MKKRAITLFLALVMCLSLCTPAMAEEIAVNEKTAYVLDETTGKANLPGRTARVTNRYYLNGYRTTYSNYESHYTLNSNLGAPTGYIFGQASSSCPNYYVGNGRFTNVGCEIAAVYNALRITGRVIAPANIIKVFERNGYVMLNGLAGSDPFAIKTYLTGIGALCTEYEGNYTSFKSIVDNDSAKAYIASYWVTDGFALHTFAFKVNSSGQVQTYNLYNNNTSIRTYDNLAALNADINNKLSNFFIVGYALY